MAATAKIEYGIVETPAGWVLRVDLAGRVPTSDRAILIEWLREYSEKVRAVRPLAHTRFGQTLNGYELEVTLLDRVFPMQTPETQRQMSFAYA